MDHTRCPFKLLSVFYSHRLVSLSDVNIGFAEAMFIQIAPRYANTTPWHYFSMEFARVLGIRNQKKKIQLYSKLTAAEQWGPQRLATKPFYDEI